jgi:galactose mutarotase-like enzyme
MVDGSTTATQKENVLISAGDCSVTILPEFGGKIASIQVKGRDLLQAPLAPVGPRTHTMSFDAGDASGWDECLPSVAACAVKTANGVAQIPDHGDLWRVDWERQGSGSREQGSESVVSLSITLRAKCFSLPLELERTIQIAKAAKGWTLRLAYVLKNEGKTAVPWSWAAHPLFATEAGDRVELPSSIGELRVEGSGGGRLGKAGDRIAWPMAKLANSSETDLSVVQDADAGIGDKIFAGPLQRDENWCALVRPSAGVRVRVGFDTALTPYLGLWLCYGGWPERPGPKQMCVAMEPSTSPVDSLAVTGPWSRTLGPGTSFSWPMQVDIENL